MRELTINEFELVSGAAVPVMLGGAAVGAVGYAGAVIGGQEFSWAELGLSVTAGAVAPMGSGTVAKWVTKELLHSMNFSFASGIMSGAISANDGNDYCNDGTNYGKDGGNY